MNKYEIIGIVGEGAYGIVYKAKCKETGEFGKSVTLPCLAGTFCRFDRLLVCLQPVRNETKKKKS